MPFKEAVEVGAIAAIKRFTSENPKIRLSARDKHQLKLDVKFRVEDLARDYETDPRKVDYERLNVASYVRNLRRRVERRQERRELSV